MAVKPCGCAFRDSLDVLAVPQSADESNEDFKGRIDRNKEHLTTVVDHTHLSAVERAEVVAAIK